MGGHEQRGCGGGNVYFQLHSCAVSLSAEIFEETAGGGEQGESERKNGESLQKSRLRKRSHPQSRAEILLVASCFKNTTKAKMLELHF